MGEPGQNSKQTTNTKNGNQCATRSLRRLNPFCAFHIHCVGTKPCANKAPARCIQPHGVRRPSAFTAALGRRRLSPPQPHATCKDGATAYLGLTCCTTNACLICDEIRRMCDEFPTNFEWNRTKSLEILNKSVISSDSPDLVGIRRKFGEYSSDSHQNFAGYSSDIR